MRVEVSIKNSDFAKYADSFTDKAKEFNEKLAKRGEGYLKQFWSASTYEPSEAIAATEIGTRSANNGEAEVYISGDHVAFIEFGTGVMVNETYGAEHGFTIGSYSKEHEGPFSKDGFWYYKKHRMSGQPATSAMPKMFQKIVSEMSEIAKEIFKK